MSTPGQVERTVLIIDDNKEYLGMLSMILRNDYHVHTVSSYEEVVSLAPDLQIDAIIVDYHVGPYTGAEMLAALSKNRRIDHIPKVLITGSIEASKALQQVNADYYLSKPFRNTELKQLLSTLWNN